MATTQVLAMGHTTLHLMMPFTNVLQMESFIGIFLTLFNLVFYDFFICITVFENGWKIPLKTDRAHFQYKSTHFLQCLANELVIQYIIQR